MNFFNSLKNILKDKLQNLLRILPRQPEIDLKNNLKSSQIYPYGNYIKNIFMYVILINKIDITILSMKKIFSISQLTGAEFIQLKT